MCRVFVCVLICHFSLVLNCFSQVYKRRCGEISGDQMTRFKGYRFVTGFD